MNEKEPGPLRHEDYLEGTRQLLEQSAQEQKPYRITVLGEEFIVLPKVFSPKYFKDTEFFARRPPAKTSEEMLEIGPGTGVISVMAAERGAGKVVAIDINPEAVKNTMINSVLRHVQDKVETRQGNLYDKLKPEEKFDTIFWNVPFGLTDKETVADLEKAVFDPHYRNIERFIKEAPAHLKKNGKILIGFSTTLGRYDLLEKFVRESGMSLVLIDEEQSEEVHPVKFELFEAKLNK